MEFKQVDPNELEIDPINERKEGVDPDQVDQEYIDSDGEFDSLVDSVSEQGIIQPPLVREVEGKLRVIVGQRRTLAAQTAGLGSIPVVVVDWDDSAAISASITENIDSFKKSVSRTDRAAAVERLKEINDWTDREVAEHLGVHHNQIGEWLERTRDEWENTSVHVDNAPDTSSEKRETIDSVDDKSVRAIRSATGGGEEGEEVLKEVASKDLSQSDVLELRKRVDRGEDIDEVVDEIAAEKEDREGSMRVNTNTTFSGDYAQALKEAAKDRGTSEDQVVRTAIEEYLTEEGYL